MKILIGMAIISILFLGVRTSYSDVFYNKAYNRDTVVFMVIGIFLQVTACFLDNGLPVINSASNILCTVVVSLAFYMADIWAAGDAKLFIAIILLIPYKMYASTSYGVFPAFFVLSLIFSVSLIYVVIESLVLLLKGIMQKKKILFRQLLPRLTKENILAWFMGYFVADTCNCLLLSFGKIVITDNAYLLILINLLLITATLSLLETTRKRILIISILAVLRFVVSLMFELTFTQMTVLQIGLVSAIIFVRAFTGYFNYRVIPTAQIREGQILARCSMVNLIPSTVKGIPKWTDETTRSRLNKEEVVAIRKWENSKYGQAEVTIVRHIPFAPFIFIGTLIFIAISIYTGALYV